MGSTVAGTAGSDRNVTFAAGCVVESCSGSGDGRGGRCSIAVGSATLGVIFGSGVDVGATVLTGSGCAVGFKKVTAVAADVTVARGVG